VSGAALNTLFRAAWPDHKDRDFDALLGHSLIWIAAHCGQSLVGFVNLAWDGGSHGFILDPTVAPELWRRGIGSALLGHAVEAARDRKLEWLHVDYESSLKGFYRKAGFASSEAGVLRLGS
jgi:ribosomal protein S18 acetylase RimI-like enzyme